jgi:hypothetical protein
MIFNGLRYLRETEKQQLSTIFYQLSFDCIKKLITSKFIMDIKEKFTGLNLNNKLIIFRLEEAKVSYLIQTAILMLLKSE